MEPMALQGSSKATPDQIYEYARHEGNDAHPGIFTGAREQEKKAAAARKE